MKLLFRESKSFKSLYFPDLESLGAIHGFSTRMGPGKSVDRSFAYVNMGLKTGESTLLVQENRRLFLKEMGLDAMSLVTGEQVHGSHVEVVRQPLPTKRVPRTDAFITAEKGVTLSLFSADCALLFFADKKNRCVGIAHAGWRGSVAKIGKNTLKSMENSFDILPTDVLVGIGPCIGLCCFEVKEDVLNVLEERRISLDDIALPAKDIRDTWHLNLPLLNEKLLIEAGVPKENIFKGELCTSCKKDLFYSYRRDKGRTGRMMGYIALPKKGRGFKG